MQYIALQCSVNSILSVLNPEYQNFLRRCIFSELLIYPFSSKRSPFVIISLHNPHNSNWFHDHLTPPPKKVYKKCSLWCPDVPVSSQCQSVVECLLLHKNSHRLSRYLAWTWSHWYLSGTTAPVCGHSHCSVQFWHWHWSVSIFCDIMNK